MHEPSVVSEAHMIMRSSLVKRDRVRKVTTRVLVWEIFWRKNLGLRELATVPMVQHSEVSLVQGWREGRTHHSCIGCGSRLWFFFLAVRSSTLPLSRINQTLNAHILTLFLSSLHRRYSSQVCICQECGCRCQQGYGASRLPKGLQRYCRAPGGRQL